MKKTRKSKGFLSDNLGPASSTAKPTVWCYGLDNSDSKRAYNKKQRDWYAARKEKQRRLESEGANVEQDDLSHHDDDAGPGAEDYNFA